MKTTTINIGDTVRIIEIHLRDAHFMAPYITIGETGTIKRVGKENITGYFSGEIRCDIQKSVRQFYAVKIEKAEPKTTPPTGDNPMTAKESQNRKVLNWLLAGQTLTTFQAAQYWNIMRLSARIQDLEKLGYIIDAPLQFEGSKHWSVYGLDPKKQIIHDTKPAT